MDGLTLYGMPVEFSSAIAPDKMMLVSLDESDPDPTYHVVVASTKGFKTASVKRSELRRWLEQNG